MKELEGYLEYMGEKKHVTKLNQQRKEDEANVGLPGINIVSCRQ